MAPQKVRVYIASSIDGFIAGPDDDLSWLPGSDPDDEERADESKPDPADDSTPDPDALLYDEFIAGVGALLMGRSTYDVVRGFGVPWPYGSRPVLVATTRPLDDDPPATVRAVAGSIDELIDAAKAAAREAGGEATGKEPADGMDVYLDGGDLIRQAAEADLIDDLTITMAPIALGAGHPLFAGMSKRYPLEIVSHHRYIGGMIQIRARPAVPPPAQPRRPAPPRA